MGERVWASSAVRLRFGCDTVLYSPISEAASSPSSAPWTSSKSCKSDGTEWKTGNAETRGAVVVAGRATLDRNGADIISTKTFYEHIKQCRVVLALEEFLEDDRGSSTSLSLTNRWS